MEKLNKNFSCVICLGLTDNPHRCQTCATDAWHCCEKCEKVLFDKICPVCRCDYARSPREWEDILEMQIQTKVPVTTLVVHHIQSQKALFEICQDFPELEHLSIIISKKKYRHPQKDINKNNDDDYMDEYDNDDDCEKEEKEEDDDISQQNNNLNQLEDLSENLTFNASNICFPKLKTLILKGEKININNLYFYDLNFPILNELILIDLIQNKIINFDLNLLNLNKLIMININMISMTSWYGHNNNFSLSIIKCEKLKYLHVENSSGFGDKFLLGSTYLENLRLINIKDLKRIDILYAPLLCYVDVRSNLYLSHLYFHSFHQKSPKKKKNIFLFDIETAIKLNNNIDIIRALCYEIILAEEANWEAGLHGYNEASFLGWDLISDETFEIHPEKLATYLSSLLSHILESAEDKLIERSLVEFSLSLPDDVEVDDDEVDVEGDSANEEGQMEEIEQEGRIEIHIEGTLHLESKYLVHLLKHPCIGRNRIYPLSSSFKVDEITLAIALDDLLAKKGIDDDIDRQASNTSNQFVLPPWLKGNKHIKSLMNGNIPGEQSSGGRREVVGVLSGGDQEDDDEAMMRRNCLLVNDDELQGGFQRNKGLCGFFNSHDKSFILTVISLTLFGFAGTAAALPKGCSLLATILAALIGALGGGLSVRLWKAAISSNKNEYKDQDGNSITIQNYNSRRSNGHHLIYDSILASMSGGPLGWIIGALIGVLVSGVIASSCQVNCNNNSGSGLPQPARSALAILLASPELFQAIKSAATACLLLLIMAIGAIVAACYAAQAVEKFHEASAAGKSFLPGPSAWFAKNGKLEFISNYISNIAHKIDVYDPSSLSNINSPHHHHRHHHQHHHQQHGYSSNTFVGGGLGLLMSSGGIAGHSVAIRGFLSFSWSQFVLRSSCVLGCMIGCIMTSYGMCKLFTETKRLFDRDPVGYVCCSIAASSMVALFGGVLGGCVGFFLTGRV